MGDSGVATSALLSTLVSETHVPDDVWSAVRPHFSDEELTGLTLLVVAINGWNRFAIAFRKLPA